MLKLRHKINLVRQLGTADCGIACLTMIFNYYGCNVNINDVQDKCTIGRDGITLSKMKQVCESYGFSFSAYKDFLNSDNLNNNLPSIMCTYNNHYIVISHTSKKDYIVYDPFNGKLTLSYEQLSSLCNGYMIIIKPTDKVKKHIKRRKLIKIPKQLKYRWIIVAIVLTLLAQFLMLVPPFLIKDIVNKFSTYGTKIQIGNYILLSILVVSSFFIVNYIEKEIILTIQNNVYKVTMHRLVNKLFHINLRFFETHSSGDLKYRFDSASDLYDLAASLLISTIIEVITGIVSGIVMFFQSYVLFLLITAITIVQLSFLIWSKKQTDELARDYMGEKSKLEGNLVDILTNIQQIRCMRMDNVLTSMLQHGYDKVIKSFKKKTQKTNLLETTTSSVSIITPLLIYIFGVYLILHNELLIGDLIAFVTLSTYYVSPFKTLSMVIPQLGNIKEGLIRLDEFSSYNEIELTGNNSIEHFKKFQMEHVFFSYDDKSKTNLRDINLSFKAGKKIAVVGTSGSGKTTLLKLIMNVLSQYRGKIKINGTDIKNIKRQDVDKLFTIITQTPVALGGSIKENIDISNSLSAKKMEEVISAACLTDLVENCPLGLNTFIGENGRNISGGQRQRIAIARAVAFSPEVMLLDEATSNLDVITEKKIYENLNHLGITQVVVTHRLSTIQDFDYIYVINSGKIAESGTHSQLMDKKGLYYSMICIGQLSQNDINNNPIQ